MFDITVVIATRNRAALLETCLRHLCRQNLDPGRYQLCIVDNGSTDATPRLVEEMIAQFPQHNILSLYEERAGVCRARNRALAATRSRFVAITDDDVRVPPDWLQKFLARFEQEGERLAIVGGGVEPVWEIPKPEWVGDDLIGYLSAGVNLGAAPRYVGMTDYFIECNSCYRRSALAEAGNFPQELGRVGDYLLSGENVVEAKIKSQGHAAFFDPGIVVEHIIHAKRLTPLWFRQRLFWQGVSGYAVRQYHIKNNIEVTPEAFLNLPLKAQDWDFINQDTAQGLMDSVFYFQSLGFALALTGLMPVEEI